MCAQLFSVCLGETWAKGKKKMFMSLWSSRRLAGGRQFLQFLKENTTWGLFKTCL